MTWNHNFSEEMTKKQVQVQEVQGNSAWGLRQSQHGSQTPLLHTSSSSSSVRSCFWSNFHEPAANRLLQNVRYHYIMHIMHHIGSYWITWRLLSTLLVCRRRTREGCTQHKSHRTSRLWNQSEPVSRILQEHCPKHRVRFMLHRSVGCP